LRGALEVELSRSRRFNRSFALVLVGIDELRQRFDYRDEEVWQASFAATAELLQGTRANVDRVYRYGPVGFAVVLPESGPKDVNGLVRRLRRIARKAKPQEGEPGGPLPAHYGATFFPTCATTVNDMIRRAEIALRLADNNANRVQLDGAEAPEMPPAETLRQPEAEAAIAKTEAIPTAKLEPVAEPLLQAVEPIAIDETTDAPVILHTPELAAEEPIKLRPAEAEPAAGPESPQPILASLDEADSEAAEAESAPIPLFAADAAPDELPNYSTHTDAVEVDEEPPFEVFAYRAPEPAVDVYDRDWQTEAPLSVIHRPQPIPRIVPLNGRASVSEPPVEDVVKDALKQLDETLELIRSLKQRSA
jgi:GGDEF domain-containing protein